MRKLNSQKTCKKSRVEKSLPKINTSTNDFSGSYRIRVIFFFLV